MKNQLKSMFTTLTLTPITLSEHNTRLPERYNRYSNFYSTLILYILKTTIDIIVIHTFSSFIGLIVNRLLSDGWLVFLKSNVRSQIRYQ